jgi:hypothetical protein
MNPPRAVSACVPLVVIEGAFSPRRGVTIPRKIAPNYGTGAACDLLQATPARHPRVLGLPAGNAYPTLADLVARCIMKRFTLFMVAIATAAAMLGALPATVRADDGVPLKGDADYAFTGIAVEPDGTVVLRYDGKGIATQLGLFTAEASIYPQFHADGTITYSGTAVFTAANGDQVFFSLEAAFTSPTTSVGSATITGGTGRFLYATGGADYEEVFADATHRQVHLTFKGTIEF